MLLSIGLALSHIFQIWFWSRRFVLWNSRGSEKDLASEGSPFVSVVIAAKNEALNLPVNFPYILEQVYPNYEVIIVDDHSTDDSVHILNELQKGYPNLTILQSGHSGKKGALQMGIEAAQGEWIVCTDADCKPNSDKWLASLMENQENADVILGYGTYEMGNKWVNSFLRYETWFIAWQYMTAAIKGNPYMGVGRNIAYRKEVFLKSNGFRSHDYIQSGDDDLFVSNLKSEKFKVLVDSDTWTISQAPESWVKLWQQKRRHLTTSPYYKSNTKIALILEYASQFLIYFLSIFGILLGHYWVLFLLLGRVIYMYSFAWCSMDELGVKRLRLFMPVLDILLCLYYGFHAVGMLWPKKDW